MALTPVLYARGGWKPKAQQHHPGHLVIAKISAESITVNGPVEIRVYHITRGTLIEYLGKKISVAALSAGMRVSVVAGMDPTVAAAIIASPAPAKGK